LHLRAGVLEGLLLLLLSRVHKVKFLGVIRILSLHLILPLQVLRWHAELLGLAQVFNHGEGG
jgi:hypothetical protein